MDEEVKAPVEDSVAVLAPIKEAIAPIEEAIAPIKEAVAPVEEAIAPIEEAVAPIEEAIAPSAPVEEPIDIRIVDEEERTGKDIGKGNF